MALLGLDAEGVKGGQVARWVRIHLVTSDTVLPGILTPSVTMLSEASVLAPTECFPASLVLKALPWGSQRGSPRGGVLCLWKLPSSRAWKQQASRLHSAARAPAVSYHYRLCKERCPWI